MCLKTIAVIKYCVITGSLHKYTVATYSMKMVGNEVTARYTGFKKHADQQVLLD